MVSKIFFLKLSLVVGVLAVFATSVMADDPCEAITPWDPISYRLGLGDSLRIVTAVWQPSYRGCDEDTAAEVGAETETDSAPRAPSTDGLAEAGGANVESPSYRLRTTCGHQKCSAFSLQYGSLEDARKDGQEESIDFRYATFSYLHSFGPHWRRLADKTSYVELLVGGGLGYYGSELDRIGLHATLGAKFHLSDKECAVHPTLELGVTYHRVGSDVEELRPWANLGLGISSKRLRKLFHSS